VWPQLCKTFFSFFTDSFAEIFGRVFIKNYSTQRAKKSAKAKIWSGILIRIFGLIRIRMSTESLPKCIGFILLSVWVILQSIVKFGRWLWKMLINLLKSRIPQWWEKWKVDPESVSRTGSSPKVNHLSHPETLLISHYVKRTNQIHGKKVYGRPRIMFLDWLLKTEEGNISYEELKMFAQDRSRWSQWRWKPP